MLSCLSGLVRVGGYNTDPVLRAVLSVGGGVTTQTACYVPSCLSGGGGGGYNTDRVLRAVLSVCRGGVGLHACHPVCVHC